jgi:DNA modification methylase/ParB-like chromosome segregation protein Spo0J
MLKFIPVDKILVAPNRQRKVFDESKNTELVESLQHGEVGLQNALVIRTEGKGKNEAYYLISGERRLRAIRDIYSLGGALKYLGQSVSDGLAPCVDVGDISTLARMEAELEENILRVDLTWQERAAATNSLWELRKAQAERDGKSAPTVVQLAAEVTATKAQLSGQYDGPAARVRREAILANHLDDPDVMKAKTSKEAFDILKKKETRAKNAELAKTVGASFSSTLHQLHNADCLVWMSTAPADQYAVILTDPPYGMGADEFGDSGGATAGAHGYDDSEEVLYDIMKEFPKLSYRLAAPDAHMYLFCDLDQFHYIKQELENAGWRVFRTPLIWSKPSGFRAPWPNKGPHRTYETILYAMKGNRETNRMGNDVLEFGVDKNVGHNAQKPVALFTELLARSARPGDKVLDPFCGSGTIFAAADSLQCYATGIELDDSFYGLAAKRLGELNHG